ncbi:MAG: TIGR04255 family protein [Planctomycetes bacterium]|nr:TIGR04255 family protein [Planctomycetota bacterium]
MNSRELKNKPLVEAIFEIRWQLSKKAPGIEYDPHYRLLLGRLFDRLQSEYPEHEQLDAANIPDEIAGQVVQHRFRVGASKWPLIQLGPGICTVNDTAEYTWSSYQRHVVKAKNHLYDAHPKPSELRVESLSLRYINAIEIDYEKNSVSEFLKDNLKVSVSLPSNLFQNTEVEPLPRHFQLQQWYRATKPKGIIQLSIATGRKSDKLALIWDTTVKSAGNDLPNMSDSFEGWLDQAHTLAYDWFFKMIDGKLHKEFTNEQHVHNAHA